MDIRFEGVVKKYGEVTAVHALDLHIADGEFLVLLGPSGCGKTTSLRMLAGLEEVTAGEIYLGAQAITRVPPQRRDIAMVFQSYALYPHMTVEENIGYPLRVRGVASDERRGAVADMAGRVGLGSLLARRPRELSGGQRQRVALARAMIRQPNAFLMDEPLSNLDANVRLQMRAELKRLQHQLRATTVYVTHDQLEAMTLAHRVAVMHEGVLQQVDTPEGIYRCPANQFVAGFIGSPPMNFLPGRIDFAERTFSCPAGALPLPTRLLDAAGGRESVTLGVRPEDVRVERQSEPGLLPARVFVAEMMGSETLVVLAAGDLKITARCGARERFDFEEPLWFLPQMDRAHLFDAATGAALTGRSQAPERR